MNLAFASGKMQQPATERPGLVVNDLSVVYDSSRGPVAAIEHLSMSIRDGEFVAIVGKSGCGKSTLLKVVSGLLRPSRGEVILGGDRVDRPRPDVGIVFQQPTLLPWKTVRGNVLAPIHAMRRPLSEYADRADELLSLVGLSSFATHYPGELSGGMQQRVAIARGLVHDPRVLLMDEPFAALDAMTREQMALDLQAFWLAAKKSVMFITHSIPEAVFLADRVFVLSPRPAHVLEVVDVPLPRPRQIESMADPLFNEVCTGLRHLFMEMG